MIEHVNKPFFSVVIPAYNRPAFIRLAIISVLNQNFTDFEIVVTDDSTNSLVQEVIESIGSEKIRYFRNTPPLKTAMNVLKGIQLAEGEFIAILNDDDYWSSDWLKIAFEAWRKNPETDLIFCDHWIVDEFNVVDNLATNNNTKLYKRDVINEIIFPTEFPQLFIDNVIPLAMASVFRKKIIDSNDFPIEISGAYDRWIVFKIIVSIKTNIIYIPKRLTYYRVHAGSISINETVASINWLVFILEKALESKYFFTTNQKNKIIINLKQLHKTGFFKSIFKCNLINALTHLSLYLKYLSQSLYANIFLVKSNVFFICLFFEHAF